MESESRAEDDALAALDAFRAELGAREAGVGLTGTRAGSWVGQDMFAPASMSPTPEATTTTTTNTTHLLAGAAAGPAAGSVASGQRWGRGEIGGGGSDGGGGGGDNHARGQAPAASWRSYAPSSPPPTPPSGVHQNPEHQNRDQDQGDRPGPGSTTSSVESYDALLQQLLSLDASVMQRAAASAATSAAAAAAAAASAGGQPVLPVSARPVAGDGGAGPLRTLGVQAGMGATAAIFGSGGGGGGGCRGDGGGGGGNDGLSQGVERGSYAAAASDAAAAVGSGVGDRGEWGARLGSTVASDPWLAGGDGGVEEEKGWDETVRRFGEGREEKSAHNFRPSYGRLAGDSASLVEGKRPVGNENGKGEAGKDPATASASATAAAAAAAVDPGLRWLESVRHVDSHRRFPGGPSALSPQGDSAAAKASFSSLPAVAAAAAAVEEGVSPRTAPPRAVSTATRGGEDAWPRANLAPPTVGDGGSGGGGGGGGGGAGGDDGSAPAAARVKDSPPQGDGALGRIRWKDFEDAAAGSEGAPPAASSRAPAGSFAPSSPLVAASPATAAARSAAATEIRSEAGEDVDGGDGDGAAPAGAAMATTPSSVHTLSLNADLMTEPSWAEEGEQLTPLEAPGWGSLAEYIEGSSTNSGVSGVGAGAGAESGSPGEAGAGAEAGTGAGAAWGRNSVGDQEDASEEDGAGGRWQRQTDEGDIGIDDAKEEEKEGRGRVGEGGGTGEEGGSVHGRGELVNEGCASGSGERRGATADGSRGGEFGDFSIGDGSGDGGGEDGRDGSERRPGNPGNLEFLFLDSSRSDESAAAAAAWPAAAAGADATAAGATAAPLPATAPSAVDAASRDAKAAAETSPTTPVPAAFSARDSNLYRPYDESDEGTRTPDVSGGGSAALGLVGPDSNRSWITDGSNAHQDSDVDPDLHRHPHINPDQEPNPTHLLFPDRALTPGTDSESEGQAFRAHREFRMEGGGGIVESGRGHANDLSPGLGAAEGEDRGFRTREAEFRTEDDERVRCRGDDRSIGNERSWDLAGVDAWGAGGRIPPLPGAAAAAATGQDGLARRRSARDDSAADEEEEKERGAWSRSAAGDDRGGSSGGDGERDLPRLSMGIGQRYQAVTDLPSLTEGDHLARRGYPAGTGYRAESSSLAESGGYPEEKGEYPPESGRYPEESGNRSDSSYRSERDTCEESGRRAERGNRTESGYSAKDGYRGEGGHLEEKGDRSESDYRAESGYRPESGYLGERGNPTGTGYRAETAYLPEIGYLTGKDNPAKFGYLAESGYCPETGYRPKSEHLAETQYPTERGYRAGASGASSAGAGFASRRHRDERSYDSSFSATSEEKKIKPQSEGSEERDVAAVGAGEVQQRMYIYD